MSKSLQEKMDQMLRMDEIDMTSLVPIRKKVKIDGKLYLLCEADGEAVRLYKNLSMRSARFGPEGKLSILEGVADVETQLVGDCLFHMDDNSNPVRKVGLEFAKKLNNRVLKPLFDLAKKISEIDEEIETEELLEKRIKDDTEKLNKLREDPLKNGLNNIRATLSSAES